MQIPEPSEQIMDKPIAFGATDQVDSDASSNSEDAPAQENKFEFGDMYHAAAALAFDRNVELVFVDDDNKYQKFFEFVTSFEPKRLSRITRKDYLANKSNFAHAGTTADLIAKHAGNNLGISRCLKVSEANPLDAEIYKFLNDRLPDVESPKVLIWNRKQDFKDVRNSTVKSIRQLVKLITHLNLKPVLIGNKISIQTENEIDGAFDNLTNCYNSSPFSEACNPVHAQLRMFRLMQERFNVIASTGMMSGGMDGPAFFAGLPAMFFCKEEDSGRMSKVCMTFGNMHIIPYELEERKKGFEAHDQHGDELKSLKDHLERLRDNQYA